LLACGRYATDHNAWDQGWKKLGFKKCSRFLYVLGFLIFFRFWCT